MKLTVRSIAAFSRQSVLGVSANIVAIAVVCGSAQAAPTGDLVILQWLSGSELDTFHSVQKAFVEKYPGVNLKEVTITWSGDARGSLRAALMGGEAADLMVNTWPSFRKELAEAGLLRSLDDAYAANGWDQKLDGFWKTLGSNDDAFYGLPYNYGDRSGLWYRKQTLADSGISEPPKDWAAFLDSFNKLNAKGVTPYVVPAKFWAHAEVFESLLLRIGGTQLSRNLVDRKVAWTDDRVKAVFRKWREMLDAKCCGTTSTMLGTDWDNAADKVLKDRSGGYVQLGMWISNRATQVYNLDPDKDFGLFQFPALGLGHDSASSIDSKEVVGLASGANPEAADAFMDFMLSPEVGALYAKAGLSSPSKLVDQSIYPPSIQTSNAVLAKSDNVFVLGDSLASDLADEYRVQLQKFLQNPSDATIDAVTAAIEAKAGSLN
jgi:ABC-type glycerol-3-phosphate transport system substrate-binding protein